MLTDVVKRYTSLGLQFSLSIEAAHPVDRMSKGLLGGVASRFLVTACDVRLNIAYLQIRWVQAVLFKDAAPSVGIRACL